MQQTNVLLQERPLPQNFLRDLVAFSGLPALWVHRAPAEIITGLAGVLLNTLYLDLVYILFQTGPEENKLEVAHSKNGNLGQEKTGEIGKALEFLLENPEVQDVPVAIANPIGDGVLQAIVMPIGTTEARGYVVTASAEASFPDDSNRLLLRIAANQAAVILRQKQAEEQLRRKQAELTDFFENASEGLHWAGPDGTILWANQAELDMLGYGHDEYIGHKIDEFHAEPLIAEDIMQRLVNDQPVHDYEARLRCKDGSIKHVLINSTVYRENGKFIHTRCFTRDITERKQVEDVLRRAYDETELRVQFRTKELSAAIEALKEEISSRKRAQAELAELRGRLSESREAERLLLAQELHDGPIQDLFALSYKLTALLDSMQNSELKSAQDEVMQVVGTLRKLCEELRPSTLISHGLEQAIQTHLEQFQQQYPCYTIRTAFGHDGRLPERISLALFRIYQQALANIVRHAQADQIEIRFQVKDGQAMLEIRDNGRGFNVPDNWIEFARQGHLGLIGGFERAEAVGGKATVTSAPGKGTQIQVSVPVGNLRN
ncbi:MAG TPA: PAS domain-containing sensor histidine kinase [Anaerolineales bacterium]|nr:PAS domain-containing sensor histidine kinase [Anaerolineales bacterium]